MLSGTGILAADVGSDVMNPTCVSVFVRDLVQPGAYRCVLVRARLYPDPAGYDFSVLCDRVYPFHDVGSPELLPTPVIFNRAPVMIAQDLTAPAALPAVKFLHSGLHPDTFLLSGFVMSRSDLCPEYPLTNCGQQFHRWGPAL